MKEVKLHSIHTRKIQTRLDKANKRFRFVGFVLLGITVFCAIVPMGFLPRSGSLRGIDKSDSIMQAFGFFPFFIILLVLALLFFWAVASHAKYFRLRKDLDLERGNVFQAEVLELKMLKGDAEPEIDVHIKQNESGLRKLNYLRSEFPGINKGDKLEVTITKKAKYIVETKKLNSRPGHNFKMNVF